MERAYRRWRTGIRMLLALLATDIDSKSRTKFTQGLPGVVFDFNTVAKAFDAFYVLYLARIVDPFEAVRGWCFIQVRSKFRDLLFERLQGPKRVDLEHRDEAAIVVSSARFDAKSKSSEQR